MFHGIGGKPGIELMKKKKMPKLFDYSYNYAEDIDFVKKRLKNPAENEQKEYDRLGELAKVGLS